MKLQSLLGPEIAAPPDAATSRSPASRPTAARCSRAGCLRPWPAARRTAPRFVPEAIAKGAAAILAEDGADIARPGGRAGAHACAEPRHALALMAARFYRRAARARSSPSPAPAARPRSPTSRARSSPRSATRPPRSAPSASSSRTAASMARSPRPTRSRCTRRWRELAGEGITHLAFEASSHGLDQHRLDGVRLKAAAFTNLGRDHLDYHPSMEAYLAAKLRLFTELLPPDGVAVVNADAEHAVEVIAAAQRKRARAVFTVGRAGEALEARSPRLATASPSACACGTRTAYATSACRCSATTRPPTRCSRPASPSPPASRPSACCRRWSTSRASRAGSRSSGGCAAA